VLVEEAGAVTEEFRSGELPKFIHATGPKDRLRHTRSLEDNDIFARLRFVSTDGVGTSH